MIRHTAISASAGSGKTFALAHRYLALLAAGVPPDRMIAMTFSRKAAGEIFDAIVRYVCEAAGSAEAAAATAARIGRPALGCDAFLEMLRRLTDHLHRTHIGTLDSFMVSVMRAFPMELGMASDFQLMDGDGPEARTVRQAVLDRIFRHPAIPESARRNFLDAFKQATFGQEEKGLERNLDRFVGRHRARYQAMPEEAAWGSPDRIWGAPPAWLASVEGVSETAEALREALCALALPEAMMARWQVFAEAVADYGFETPWSRDVEYLFEKLAAQRDALRTGNAELKIGRALCSLDSAACRLVLRLMDHVMHTDVTRALRRTKGLYRILDQYEDVYDRQARGRGHLTFDDVQFMLTESNRHSGGRVLSRSRGDAAKLYIDYRLDCQLDHWMLDEFQDTSDLQWQVLANLADEILQDAGGQRSFFYVGDVKQAIYGWRGGNARLFEKVRRRYGKQIVSEQLDASFRSCPPVIDTVNRVFEALPGDLLPPAVVEEWARVWRPHTCAAHLRHRRGYAAVLEPSGGKEGVKPVEEDRFRLVAALLRDIQPLQRGLSVAVLVRKNESGRRLVDVLRRECRGVTVIHEGNAPITRNPVVAALLSLVKVAAHPGDTLARQHLRMTPLKGAVEQVARHSDLAFELLRRLQAEGFEAFVRHWGAVLEEAASLDRYGRLRLNDLIDAAGQFDGAGGGSCNEFLRFIENYEIRDQAAAGVVTVMTVHQSKGLGFDVVLLPDLMDGNLARAREVELVTRRDPETHLPRWLLCMPRRLIAEADPALGAALTQVDAEAGFEALCVLYVAMTRAKRALYIITSYPGKTSRAATPAALVKTQLAGDAKAVGEDEAAVDGMPCHRLYEAGDARWYDDLAPVPPAPAPPVRDLPAEFGDRPSSRVRLARVAPSMQDAAPHSAGWLFAGENREILNFGTAIHALFEAIEWVEDADVEAILAEWSAASDDTAEVKRDVAEQFRNVLASAAVRRLMARPAGRIELWREKRFEIVLDGRWVTGAFDRVQISRDPSGDARDAVIMDYKSNRIATASECAAAAETYRPQLDLYARALAVMLRLPVEAIERKLLFTRAGCIVTV